MSHITRHGTFLTWQKVWERCWVDVLIYNEDENDIEIYFYDTQAPWWWCQ